MWTLAAMHDFVLAHTVEVTCPSCRKGKITFKAILVVYPDWNTETYEEEVHVGVDVMFNRQSCFCKNLVESEVELVQKQAHEKMYEIFQNYLKERKEAA